MVERMRGIATAMDRLATQPEHADFVAQAAAWRQAFAGQPGKRWALYLDSTIDFAAALLGAWHAGKHVVLPGDTRPETLDALRPAVDGMAGDLPQGLRPVPLSAASALAWSPLSARDTGVTLFTSGSTGVPLALDKRLAQLDAEVRALEQAFGAAIPSQARVLATVSHQHIYGLLFMVLWEPPMTVDSWRGNTEQSMTHDEIFARVKAVLEQMFEIAPELITLDARLYDDLDIDSIDAVDLLVRLKPLLAQPLKPEQFKSVRTVRDVVHTVARLIDSSATTA